MNTINARRAAVPAACTLPVAFRPPPASRSSTTMTFSPPLRFDANAFANTTDINTAASLLLTAISTLRTDSQQFGSNATLIQTRQDFTSNLINSLTLASNNLVLADTNQEGASLQQLQAQNQLAIVSLGISGQLTQAILRLFP